MGATRGGLPEGRYGRVADGSSTRRLRVVGAVLGAGLLALVGWFGWSYVGGQDVSGELIGYEVVSDDTVEVHLEVRKDAAAQGVCTLRSRAADGAEVGLKDVRITERASRVDMVVEMLTKARAANAELLGCRRAD
jgi:hypothetical protein